MMRSSSVCEQETSQCISKSTVYQNLTQVIQPPATPNNL